MSLDELKIEFEVLLEKGDKQELRQFLDDQNIIDIANLVYEYEDQEAAIIAGMSIHRAAGVFKILEFPTQRQIINTLPPNKTAELLNELPPDDRTDFLEELPSAVVRELIKLMDGKERK